MPPSLILPKSARDSIAVVAADAARTVADRPIPGPSKFNAATALGMRRLKADGMPEDLSRLLAPFAPADEVDPDVDGDLTDDELLIVEGVSSAAGVGVGVIADRIEADTGCACNRQVLGLIRALLQTGIEVAARGIKASI